MPIQQSIFFINSLQSWDSDHGCIRIIITEHIDSHSKVRKDEEEDEEEEEEDAEVADEQDFETEQESEQYDSDSTYVAEGQLHYSMC